MVVTVMIPIFARARRRWGHPAPESRTSVSAQEARTPAPPIAAPAPVAAAPSPAIEAASPVTAIAPGGAKAPGSAIPEASKPPDAPRLWLDPPTSAGSARDDGAPARTPTGGGGPLDDRGPVPG